MVLHAHHVQERRLVDRLALERRRSELAKVQLPRGVVHDLRVRNEEAHIVAVLTPRLGDNTEVGHQFVGEVDRIDLV